MGTDKVIQALPKKQVSCGSSSVLLDDVKRTQGVLFFRLARTKEVVISSVSSNIWVKEGHGRRRCGGLATQNKKPATYFSECDQPNS